MGQPQMGGGAVNGAHSYRQHFHVVRTGSTVLAHRWQHRWPNLCITDISKLQRYEGDSDRLDKNIRSRHDLLPDALGGLFNDCPNGH
jgi:hypothetical protein